MKNVKSWCLLFGLAFILLLLIAPRGEKRYAPGKVTGNLTVNGQIKFADGTLAAPGLTPTSLGNHGWVVDGGALTLSLGGVKSITYGTGLITSHKNFKAAGTFAVDGSTTLGNSGSDTVTVNAGTVTYADTGLVIDFDGTNVTINYKGADTIFNYDSTGTIFDATGQAVELKGLWGFSDLVGVGTTSLDASALLQCDSTTQGFLPPRMTSTQRDAISTPIEGLNVYDLTNNVPNFRSDSAWRAYLHTAAGSLTSGSLLFADGKSSVTDDNIGIFYDDSSNRVGIGTITPDLALDIESLGTPQQQTRWSDSAGSGAGIAFRRSRGATVGADEILVTGDKIAALNFFGFGTAFSSAAKIEVFVDGTPSGTSDMPGRIVLSTSADGSATPTERMRIGEDGAVWIGDGTAPGTLTKIFNIVDASPDIYLEATGDNDVKYYAATTDGGNQSWAWGLDSSDGDRFSIAHANTLTTSLTSDSKFTISTAGIVGIGSTATQTRAQLVVLGNVVTDNGGFGFLNVSGGTGTASGAVTSGIFSDSRMIAAEFNANSDRRIKENVFAYDGALEAIGTLNVVAYNKLARTGDSLQELGLIGQELTNTFPLALRITPGDVPDGNGGWKEVEDFHQINYQTVFMLAIRAIQEQQVQIDALKAERGSVTSAQNKAGVTRVSILFMALGGCVVVYVLLLLTLKNLRKGV